jgi:hypothetical protein
MQHTSPEGHVAELVHESDTPTAHSPLGTHDSVTPPVPPPPPPPRRPPTPTQHSCVVESHVEVPHARLVDVGPPASFDGPPELEPPEPLLPPVGPPPELLLEPGGTGITLPSGSTSTVPPSGSVSIVPPLLELDAPAFRPLDPPSGGSSSDAPPHATTATASSVVAAPPTHPVVFFDLMTSRTLRRFGRWWRSLRSSDHSTASLRRVDTAEV